MPSEHEIDGLIDRGNFMCERCGDILPEQMMCWVYFQNDIEQMCPDCASCDEDLIQCENCGDYFHADIMSSNICERCEKNYEDI
jgi:hypothetical protein